MPEPKTNHLAVMIPDQLRTALDYAASRRFTSASEYVRQGIIEKMRSDGIEPTQIQHAAAAGGAGASA